MMERDFLKLPPPTPAKNRTDIVHDFHSLYYFNPKETWENTFYKGIPVAKCPLDLWVYGEIIHETKPTVILETGTWNGGSAHWLADNSDANVITIDINPAQTPPHERVTYITADSASHHASFSQTARVMVILDSDHSEQHVYQELLRFAPLVTPGCYLIVEDTNVSDGVHNDALKGLARWLNNPTIKSKFEIDRTREKFMLTFNPSGYLRRK